MKCLFVIRTVVIALLLGGVSGNLYAEGLKKEESRNDHAKQILIVGLNDNVKSNYFYKGMIAEETGMIADSIGSTYNEIIAQNIATAATKSDCRFVSALDGAIDGQVLNEIKVNGESEECYSDLSNVPVGELQKVLDNNGSDYLLVLNQHYLKWQDQPLRTLFHIVSYTLFDKDKNEIYRGNNYFTCMNLEKPDQLRKLSRKTTSKIASTILKTLDE